MTEADPDAIGPDGCGHVAPISVAAAIRIMGSGDATVKQLA